MGDIVPQSSDCQIIDQGAVASGCFTLNQSYNAKQASASGIDGNYGFSFDASDGDELYSGNKLQVSALQTLVCIKV